MLGLKQRGRVTDAVLAKFNIDRHIYSREESEGMR